MTLSAALKRDDGFYFCMVVILIYELDFYQGKFKFGAGAFAFVWPIVAVIGIV